MFHLIYNTMLFSILLDVSYAILGAGIGANVLTGENRNRSDGTSVNERISKGLSFLNSESTNDNANHSRESFFRAVSTSGSSELQGLTERRDASLTEARAQTLEAGRLEEAGNRFDHLVSDIHSGGFQSSRDYSQNWQNFASSELARNPALRDSGYETWMRDSDLNDRQRQARNELETRFRKSFVDEIRQELGPIGPHASMGIANPAGDVGGWGRGQIGEVNGSGPSVNVAADSRDAGR